MQILQAVSLIDFNSINLTGTRVRQARKVLRLTLTKDMMMQGREVETSPFVRTRRTHVAETVSKLVNTKRILDHFFVIPETFCESSARGPTITNGVILPLIQS